MGITLDGTNGIDLDGTELKLDADADTSITADTDDRIDFKIAGSDRGNIHYDGNDFFSLESNDYLTLVQNQTAERGLILGPTYFKPYNANDTHLDLGIGAARWKDLYLSGGVNFSANANASGMTSELLDDYEEGTWTPALATSGINVGYSTQAGNYTKIGQEVFVNFQMNINSLTSAGSGTVYISGLPFTFSSGKNYGRYNIQTYNVNLDGTFSQMFAYASGGTTLGILYSFDNSTWSGASTSNFAISSNSIISGSFHYIGE